MKHFSIVVIDLGGTKINFGLYRAGNIVSNIIKPFDGTLSVSDSILFIKACIDEIKASDTCAVAIGVPSIVDVELGIVFDATNIKSWQKVNLKGSLEALLAVPVYVNNDVNCFVKGEHVAKKNQPYQDMVGLCLGTGLGAGIVLQNKVYSGVNGCAGEVGNFSYLQGTLDDYCSGKFFKDHYLECGAKIALRARAGDKEALIAFDKFGQHLAVAVSHILLVLDPQLIVIGGSVAKSFDLFIDSLWQNLAAFPYQSVIKKLIIEQSSQENSALLGAACLYLETLTSDQISATSPNVISINSIKAGDTSC